MTDWPVERIDDHREQAIARFTSQYHEAKKLREFTGAFVDRFQGLEDAVQQLLRDRWVDEAEGQQLDELGEIVGEPRLGRVDSAYRPAIVLRAELNRAGGEPESIIGWVRRTFKAEIVVFLEMYPAKIEIYTRFGLAGDVLEQGDFVLDNGDQLELDDGDTLEVVSLERGEIASQIDRIKEIIPAGVGTVYFCESDDEFGFGVNEVVGGEFQLGLDDGDLLELDDGDTLNLFDASVANIPPEWVRGTRELDSDWILYYGAWDDSGVWLDSSQWIDDFEVSEAAGTIAELFEV